MSEFQGRDTAATPIRHGNDRSSVCGKLMRLVLEAIDGFHLKILLKTVNPHRPADSRLLVSSHRREGIRIRPVERDPPGADAAAEFITTFAVLAEDIAAQAENRVIR